MKTGNNTFRSLVLRYATLVFIGISFLTYTVAATSAASVSFIDTVKGLFGIATESIPARSVEGSGEGGRITASTTFVISQAYGGGGGTTGTYIHDYVELKNISSSPQSLTGLQLMYGS